MKACTDTAEALKSMIRETMGDIPVYTVGDCVRASKVYEAGREGFTAAMSIL